MSENDRNNGNAPTAVALRYDGVRAPRITAKGSGHLAEQILQLAEDNDIPLHEDRDLVTLLAQLDLGQEIPASLYQAVAEVIAFTYLMSGREPPKPGVPRDGDTNDEEEKV